ncbi:MAG: alcohol dehydrogenase catalytic domain-containing protein [Dissulfurispiraceae bacterium]|jgi:L-iditol 2-dehydrogenase|nr:alcohol dehydrogenase catalytic domain-containing protein [Dissulfurispiraceae bacterium]
MKVAKLYSFEDIRIEEMPVPKVGPNDALIKTKASGICSGDVMPWYIAKKAPLVLGHEPSGEIVELGNELTSSHFKVGDRVAVHHHAPCMSCSCCNRGDYVQCSTWRKTFINPGGIAEYILIPETNLLNDTLVLPDSVSFEDGCLVEPVACVVKSLKRANIKRGDTVLIIGLGVMGQMHVLMSREYGAGRIIAVDKVEYRLNKALEFGADFAIDVSKDNLNEKLADITNGHMANIVIVGPNSAEAMKQGISCSSRGGTVVLFTPALPDEKLLIDPNEIYFKDISIVTSYSCGPDDTKTALSLIAKKLVTADKLITHRFAIEKTYEAYRLTISAKDSLKSAIIF